MLGDGSRGTCLGEADMVSDLMQFAGGEEDGAVLWAELSPKLEDSEGRGSNVVLYFQQALLL